MSTITNNTQSKASTWYSHISGISKKAILLSALVAAMMVSSNDVKATHASGADISYQCLGSNDSIRIEVAFYRACSGIGAPPTVTVTVSSASCGQSFTVTAVQDGPGVEIIPYCAAEQPTECGGGPASRNAREQYLYVDTLTLPAVCTDWTFSYSICCRNGGGAPDGITNIVSPGAENIYVEATMNNSIFPCNSSPVFTNPPAPFVYTGATVCYNNGAVDLDGDSLVYTMITPMTGPSSQVTYNFPFTNTQPLSSSPAVTINPATGDICMTPTVGSEVTVLAILVEEYRYGTLIGSVVRDIQVNVIPLPDVDLLPATDGIDGTGIYTDTIATGCNFSFNTSSSDADGGDLLSLFSNIGAAIPGASFIISGNGTATPSGTFSWTPGPTDVSNTPHCFVTGLYDDACPVNGSELKAWCFKVIEFSALFTNTGPGCVGDSMNFYSQYDYSGYSYVWDFGIGSIATLAMATAVNPVGVVYANSGTKTVILTITSPTGCIIQDTNIFTINPIPSASFSSSASTLSKCAGDTVSFLNLGSSGPSVSHAWDFGLLGFPASSNIESPAPIIYMAGAPITTTHTVTNQFGCMSSATVNFTINEMPVADFSSNAPSCTGTAYSVDFANTGTTGASYFWDFGSGATPATSTSENPTGVTYTTAGGDIKTVYLITTLGSCSDSIAQTINVFETPIPSFTHDGPACEEDELVTFTYTGTTGTGWTYDWDFGGVASPPSSNAENPSPVMYVGAGTKTVTLTVTNGACSDTVSANVVINPTPIADFASNAPSCTGDSVYFINTGTTGAVYAWDFGSGSTPGTSILENPLVVEYDTTGGDIKNIQLITTLGSCVDTMGKTINITETPAPAFTHDAMPDACEGATVTFTYTGTTDPGWTYAWDFGAGSTPATSTAVDSIEVSYMGIGAKTVSLTVTGVCSESTTSNSITIVQTPIADFSTTAPSCTGDSVDFMSTGTTGATYAWTFGTGSSPSSSATENQSDVIYSSEGIKSVMLITTLGGCVDTSMQTINLSETPTPAFTNDGPHCEGVEFVFAYTGTNGLGWTYDWDFGAGATPNTSSADSISTTTYMGAGNKTVTLTVTNDNCSSTSIDNSILVYESPVASLASTAPSCTGDSVDFTNTGSTSGSWSYAWSFDSGSSPSTSNVENPTDIVYSTAGTKLITLIVGSTTCTDTAIVPININLRPTAAFNSTAPQCAGMNVDFDNTGSTGSNWNYLWDFGGNANPATSNAEQPTDIKFSTGGVQWISFTISDQNCSETFANTISIDTLPTADAGNDTTICADLSVQIGSSNMANITYSWFPSDPSVLSNSTISDPTATPKAPITNYVVTVTDLNGCISSDSVAVTMLQSAVVDAGPDAEICWGESVQLGLGLIEGQTYSWSPSNSLDNPSTSNPIATPLTSTTYTVTVSFENCPQLTDEVYAEVHPLPDARATDYLLLDTTYITLGNSIQLVATGGLQFSWLPELGLSNPGLYNPIASPDSTTDYSVKVVDIYGCVNWDTVRVDVDSIKFFVPTAFTPDGNGFNDAFMIRIEDLESFELIIWDRWGEQVFISRDATIGWEGINQTSGDKMPQGAYVYSFKGTDMDGEVTSQSGLINLIR